MNNERLILNKFKDFAKTAAPMLFLKNEEAYENALIMVEHLMEFVGENEALPENLLISLLHNAIHLYESKNKNIADFNDELKLLNSDVATLRMIIDQYQLNLDDFPEIGHKSLISKILAGTRSLTKNHIIKLSERFHLDPALFF